MRIAVLTLFLHICQSNLDAFYFSVTFQIFYNMSSHIHAKQQRQIEFWTLEIKFSYNFIISAGFCNELLADVDQINPQKSGHL